MGARHDICEMVKRAQGIANDAVPSVAKKTNGGFAENASRFIWGGLGSLASLLNWSWDNTFGGGSQGSIADYMRTGARVGAENSGLMNASLAQGVAGALPFAGKLQSEMNQWADWEQKKRVSAIMKGKPSNVADMSDVGDIAIMRAMAGGGGDMATNGLLWKAMPGKLFRQIFGGGAKMLRASDKLAKGMGAVGEYSGKAALPVSSVMSSHKDIQEEYSKFAKDKYIELIEAAKSLDQSSPEYAKEYEALKLGRGLDAAAFESLPIPSNNDGSDQVVAEENGRPTSSGGNSQHGLSDSNNGWSSWYNGLHDWQKTLAWGAGGAGIGALLGSMFGGKGSGWRMALLGLLLGAMGGNGNIGKLWNSIRGGQNTQAVG